MRDDDPDPEGTKNPLHNEVSGIVMGPVVQAGSITNTQINYVYRRTVTDGVAAPPLLTVSGQVDSPYRGLAAFDERDAPFYFGREVIATEVLERMSHHLRDRRLLVVSGVSGAGKSSLLRAGVLPRIRGEGLASAPGSESWPCLVFTPGESPLDALAVRTATLARIDAASVLEKMKADPAGYAIIARQAALAQPGPPDRRLLLVVDQFEQVLRRTEEEQREFVTALHAAATTGHEADGIPAALVVLVVRADFEARCADHPELTQAVKDRYLVTAMTRRQLRMAITEPAAKVRSRVEDSLVRTLLDEVGTQVTGSAVTTRGAGALPLVSHALDQAWRGRAGSTLALADYERIGGVEGAVAGSAQRAFDRLTTAQRAAARQVFLRLTTISGDGVTISRRAGRAELLRSPHDPQDVEAVLESFAAERLLTLAADTVEISHEVLLTAWPLLRDTWLGDTLADRLARTRLSAAAAEWDRLGRDQSSVYRGSLLRAAVESVARADADPDGRSVTDVERDFVLAGRRVSRRAVRRQRALTAFLVVVALALATAAYVAYRARAEAVHQRDAIASDQLALKSRTENDADPALAKVESVAAWRIAPSPRSRSAMLAAAARPDVATFVGHSGWVLAVAYSPDGKTVASVGDDNTIRLWDVGTRSQIGDPLAGDNGVLSVLAFSPDGRTLAAGGFDSDDKVRLWDVDSRRQVSAVPIQAAYTSGIAFSRDGGTLAVAENDGSTVLWDIATGTLVARLGGHTGAVMSVEYSPDGRTLATAGEDGTVRLWDALAHGQIGDPIVTGAKSVNVTTFSPDGLVLASAGEDLDVRLWDVATRTLIGTLSTDDETSVSAVVFAPDGKTVAAAGAAGTIRLWDTTSKRPLGARFTTSRHVTSLAFSPDGATLASADFGGVVRLWNTRSQAAAPIAGSTNAVVYSPDGRVVATVGDDAAVSLWDAASHDRLALLTGHTGPVTSAVFSPDGKRLATAGVDGSVRLWDTDAHRQTASIAIPRERYFSAAFSPDGRTLAVIGDGPVLLWDVLADQVAPLPDSGNSIYVASPGSPRGAADTWIAFAPDGRTLATAHGDEVLLWDTATRQRTGKPLTGHVGAIRSVAFSPDGSVLATGSKDQTARLWDVGTHDQIGAPLTGHADGVSALSFSPDGRALATGSSDGVRLWDTGTHLQISVPHTDQVTSLAFAPDGRILASASEEGVRLWDVSYLADDLPHRLCAEASRSLSQDDWTRYVASGPVYRTTCP
ncbi:WD40 repeat domain-containing protein [Umezawaea tangerina]|nr:WD40 repeat domain-containing protein [Umezawaea tangerina]